MTIYHAQPQSSKLGDLYLGNRYMLENSMKLKNVSGKCCIYKVAAGNKFHVRLLTLGHYLK